jgi:PAS domain-containing protein
MKSKTNQLTILYIIIALFVAVAFHKFSFKNYSLADYQLYNLSKDLVIVFVTGFTFRYILSNNDNKNKATLEKLAKTNEEIKESNEKYDILAKATSDTIWDWKIKEDKLIWKEGIKSIFGYEQEEVGDTSKWWFDNIHPEDRVKMSIKFYSFLEQKTENWQDEYRFKCADNSYK